MMPMFCARTRKWRLFFEKAAKGSDGKKVANWIMGDFFAMLKARHLELEQSPVKPECIGKLVNLINSGVISGNIGKEVFLLMADTGEEPEKIVEEKGLKQVTDTGAIEAIIDQVIADIRTIRRLIAPAKPR